MKKHNRKYDLATFFFIPSELRLESRERSLQGPHSPLGCLAKRDIFFMLRYQDIPQNRRQLPLRFLRQRADKDLVKITRSFKTLIDAKLVTVELFDALYSKSLRDVAVGERSADRVSLLLLLTALYAVISKSTRMMVFSASCCARRASKIIL
jgi:hypothetical protein